jgi:hypothetical protein
MRHIRVVSTILNHRAHNPFIVNPLTTMYCKGGVAPNWQMNSDLFDGLAGEQG